MRSLVAAISLACVFVASSLSNASAKPRHGVHGHHASHVKHHRRHRQHRIRHADGRPSAWCGWWMRRHLGIADTSLNLARNWVSVGSAAGGPAPGVIGVQRHHVFKVISVIAPGRVLAISGNDSHAVRTRVRSTSNVIAWRRV